jgi:MOSC domain-containing protein YiiM
MEKKMQGTLLSIQVGKPARHRADAISDKPWRSGIFKEPVAGRVWLDMLNLNGDAQADLDNHGGPWRAVLSYSAEHYPIWREEYGVDFPHGAFGENFTVSGLDEESVCLGDIFAVGEVRLQVAQQRYPCWKLARRNGLKDLTARVLAKGWGGWYCQVLQQGFVEAGDKYELIERSYPKFTIAYMNDLITKRKRNSLDCEAISNIEVMTPEYRELFARLAL